MKCIICDKGITQVRVLHRISEKGVPGQWVCDEHYSQTDAAPIDPIVYTIVNAIGEKK